MFPICLLLDPKNYYRYLSSIQKLCVTFGGFGGCIFWTFFSVTILYLLKIFDNHISVERFRIDLFSDINYIIIYFRIMHLKIIQKVDIYITLIFWIMQINPDASLTLTINSKRYALYSNDICYKYVIFLVE